MRDPESLVPAAEPLVDGVVPLVQAVRPGAGRRPACPRTPRPWSGSTARSQLVGGLALATGKGRRLGAALLAASLVPTTIAKYPFWSRSDPEERAADRDHFLKNVSLLGGVLIASRDTEGKPSLGLARAEGRPGAGQEHQRHRADTKKAGRKVAEETRSELADAALAGGAALVGAVVGTSRQEPQEGRQAARGGQEDGGPAGRGGQAGGGEGRQAGPEGRRQVRQGARGRDAGKQLEAAKKEAAASRPSGRPRSRRKKVTENIQLGEN